LYKIFQRYFSLQTIAILYNRDEQHTARGPNVARKSQFFALLLVCLIETHFEEGKVYVVVLALADSKTI